MPVRAVDDKSSDTLVVVSEEGFWTGSSTLPHLHQHAWASSTSGGVVIGDEVDAFAREHRAALTGQQFQSADNEPYYVLFEDFTPVRFHRRSLYDVRVLHGSTFDGVVHVDDWVPQRLVTATGPNPLPR